MSDISSSQISTDLSVDSTSDIHTVADTVRSECALPLCDVLRSCDSIDAKAYRVQHLLVLVLDAYRLHKVDADALPVLPHIGLFPATSAATSDNTDVSDSDDSTIAPHPTMRVYRSLKRLRPHTLTAASKNKRLRPETARTESTERDYLAAVEQLFDRLMIWDALHYCPREENSSYGVSASFRAFMSDTIAKRYNKDLHAVTASLHKKCGLPAPAPPISITQICASSPSRGSRTSMTTPTKRSARRAAPAPSSVVRRMARAAAAANTKPRLSRTSSASLLLSADATSTSAGRHPAGSIATLTKRVVSNSGTAPNTKTSASAAEKARQVLERKKRMEERTLSLRSSKRNLKSDPETTGMKTCGITQSTDITKHTNEKQLKADILMAKRMSGGSGMSAASFAAAKNAMKRSQSFSAGKAEGDGTTSSAEAVKEKLKIELKRTERLRGPEMILKRQ
ncbi:hypothetical protein HDU84_003331 [Entophlyctis sp. JEL0112]|nr:hypothetical protein HDU84_003331 [Entophlyctis sp. JEL0112]